MKKIYFLLTLSFFYYSTTFGQFGPKQIISKGTDQLQDVFSIDIDGDGDMDILSASYKDNKIAWYKNDGTGNFGEQQIISANANGAIYVYACDIDNDGDIDVLSASREDNKIAWYRNGGTGNFGEQQIISVNVGEIYVYACDIDSDGDIDILSASNNKIAWYQNDGTGNFGEQQIISADAGAIDVYACDINNDGDIDVLSASNNKIAWYKNDGNENFGTQNIISSDVNGPKSIYAADLDNDGDMDVLSASSEDDKIAWYKNDGTGNFGEQQIITVDANKAIDVYACDIDGDGNIDVISASKYDNKLAWYQNDGTGIFTTQYIMIINERYIESVYASDIDGDGDMDILTASSGADKLAWYQNDGTGTFITETVLTICETNGPISTHSCDLDGDGNIDILSASYDDKKIAWYRNTDGFGNYESQEIIDNNANGVYSVYACDIDGDGDMDVLSASVIDSTIAWYENTDGLGNFSTKQVIINNATHASSVIADDIDGDGDNDVLYTYEDSLLVWIENTNGLGDFSNPQLISDSIYVNFYSLNSINTFIIDIDGDNDNDVLASFYGGKAVVWFKNTNGLGDFSVSQQILTSTGPFQEWRAYPADFDNDGDIDILTSRRNPEEAIISWYENTDGLGSYVVKQQIHDYHSYNYYYFYNYNLITAFDVDNDGDIDAVNKGPLGISWFANTNSQGDFSSNPIEITTIPIEIATTNTESTVLFNSDVNGDGLIDIVSSNYSSDEIYWMQNISNNYYQILGSVFFDKNQNGEIDTLEYGFNLVQTQLNPNALSAYTSNNGNYYYFIDSGSYVLNYLPIPNWELTTDSVEYNIETSTSEPIIDSLDFGYFPTNFITDLKPDITIGRILCNDTTENLWLNYQNTGTTSPNGIVELILDPQITYISSTINPDSIIGQNLYWHFDSLNFFALGQIPLAIQSPDFNSMGNTLVLVLNIYTTDSTGQFFFTDTLSRVLTCSYDPNDKIVTPRGSGSEGVISKDETLEYTVHFQNTGNAEAINIKIRDQIDENIDIESIQILASSHQMHAYTQQNRWLVFQFDSIMLPDSSANELASQGFVKYSAKLKSDVLPNTQILNTAHIYFDYNPPIITNTVLNTVECYTEPLAPEITQNNNLLEVETDYEIQWFLNGSQIPNASGITYQFTENGNYSVIVIDENGCFSESEVHTVTNVNVNNIEKETVVIYPNPTTGKLTIETKNIERIEIYNLSGILIETTKQNTIDLSKQAKGIYFVKVVTIEGIETKKIVLE